MEFFWYKNNRKYSILAEYDKAVLKDTMNHVFFEIWQTV